MSIRINFTTESRATVHEQPRWPIRLVRRLLGQTEFDYEVWRIREMGARFVWVTHDNRPVSRRVADAIARAVASRGGGRVRLVRGGR